jgi:O-antigen/teichoic acid export membrane protein
MESNDLHEATVKGVRWLAAMRVVSECVGLASMVVLARLVSPAQFGHAAIALIFIVLGDILCFEGFSSTLIQRATITEDDRRGAMFMSITGGLLLSLLVYGLVGPLWTPLFGARTAALIGLVSPSIFISALGGVSRSTVWRRLDFRTTSSIDAAGLFVTSVASIALALAGDGATAIVLGGLIGVAASTGLMMIAAPPPLPRWSRTSQRDITTFGIPSALAGLAAVTCRNIDYAILAARLPASTVGLYYRAFNVSVIYQDKLSRIMTQIAFPVYARTEDRDSLRAFHERVARLHAIVIFPMLASIAVLAPALIPLVFGPAWRGAVPATQILAGAGMAAAILTGYSQVMLALGRARPLLWFNVATTVLYGAAVFLASRHGLVVIAFTVCGVYLVILLSAYQFLLNRYLGLSITRLIRELGPALAGCVALVIVDLALLQGLVSLSDFGIVMIAGPAGLIAYALVIRGLFPRAWNDLGTLITRVFPPIGRLRRGRSRDTAPGEPLPGEPLPAAVARQ